MEKYLSNGKNIFHMEKKLSMRIIDVLLREESHARELARKLNTNHMTVINKLRELIDENVLDFRMEGRNKIYFIKRNVEARNYVIMAELYKLNKTLKRYPELRNIIESIQKNPRIKLALLFGSYARHCAKNASDIDIFIETKDRNLKKSLELLNSKLIVKIGDYDESSPLIREIEKNHVVIKGVELYYEKTRFFY
ncbi:MAG: nucleotidyltransferase domain-containing protein [Candidatus Methanofastidiosia archaeon]